MMKTTRHPVRSALPFAFAALALAGCNKKMDDQPKAAAGSELLPRSVSDDMLPYDTVTSQASLSDPDAGLRTPRLSAPDDAASIAPVEESVPEAEEVPVIEAAPPPDQP